MRRTARIDRPSGEPHSDSFALCVRAVLFAPLTCIELQLLQLVLDAGLLEAFVHFYVVTAVRKFFFFLDPRRRGRIAIKDLLLSPILQELLDLRRREAERGDVLGVVADDGVAHALREVALEPLLAQPYARASGHGKCAARTAASTATRSSTC